MQQKNQAPISKEEEVEVINRRNTEEISFSLSFPPPQSTLWCHLLSGHLLPYTGFEELRRKVPEVSDFLLKLPELPPRPSL